MLKNLGFKIKRNLFPVITCSLALIILLIFLFANNGIENLRQLIPQIQGVWLLAALATAVLTMLLEGLTLHLFCRHLYSKWTYGRSFSVGMTGLLYSAITPFSTGGQPMQIYAMRKMGMDTGKAGSIIAMKTLSYQVIMVTYALILMCLQLGFFIKNVTNLAFITIIGLISNAAFIGLVFLFTISAKGTDRILHFLLRWLYRFHLCRHPLRRYHSIHQQLSMFHNSSKLMGRSWKLYVPVVLLTILQISLTGSIPYMIYRSFGLPAENVQLITMLAAQQFVMMVSAFVPLPGASGGAEGSFLMFFRTFFQDTITPAILLWRLITYYLNILLGAIFSSWGGKRYTDEKKIASLENKG
ncbi:MAG: lysylphosphatidylglycerol synthase transmembrane domain-containing protein [Hydrogeniiclostridium sp.]